MANEGLFTFVIPIDVSADFIKKVFPAPRSPFKTIRSPFLQDETKPDASKAVSDSLVILITEGYLNKLLRLHCNNW